MIRHPEKKKIPTIWPSKKGPCSKIVQKYKTEIRNYCETNSLGPFDDEKFKCRKHDGIPKSIRPHARFVLQSALPTPTPTVTVPARLSRRISDDSQLGCALNMFLSLTSNKRLFGSFTHGSPSSKCCSCSFSDSHILLHQSIRRCRCALC